MEGYDIEQPDVWESESVGTGLRAAFVALCVALVVTLVYLATPLIDYVVEIYPSPEALTQARTRLLRYTRHTRYTGIGAGGRL